MYNNIQSQIDGQLATLSTADISARRRALLEDFVRTKSSRSPGPSSAPVEHHMLSYRFRDSQDPLKIELNSAEFEPGASYKKRQLGALAPLPRWLNPRRCHQRRHLLHVLSMLKQTPSVCAHCIGTTLATLILLAMPQPLTTCAITTATATATVATTTAVKASCHSTYPRRADCHLIRATTFT